MNANELSNCSGKKMKNYLHVQDALKSTSALLECTECIIRDERHYKRVALLRLAKYTEGFSRVSSKGRFTHLPYERRERQERQEGLQSIGATSCHVNDGFCWRLVAMATRHSGRLQSFLRLRA